MSRWGTRLRAIYFSAGLTRAARQSISRPYFSNSFYRLIFGFPENGNTLDVVCDTRFFQIFSKQKQTGPYASTILFGTGLMVQGWRISHPRPFSVSWNWWIRKRLF